MNQKKIENLIWDISSKTKIPDPPNKEEAWGYYCPKYGQP